MLVFFTEKKFLLYRMSTTETLFSRMKVGSDSNDDDDNDSDLDSEKLLHELMAEARLHSQNLSTQASQPCKLT